VNGRYFGTRVRGDCASWRIVQAVQSPPTVSDGMIDAVETSSRRWSNKRPSGLAGEAGGKRLQVVVEAAETRRRE
jgi:hypothetical protein